MKWNNVLMLVGLLLVLCGYRTYTMRNESPHIKAVFAIMWLVPGWALLAMGYVGNLVQSRNNSNKNE